MNCPIVKTCKFISSCTLKECAENWSVFKEKQAEERESEMGKTDAGGISEA